MASGSLSSADDFVSIGIIGRFQLLEISMIAERYKKGGD